MNTKNRFASGLCLAAILSMGVAGCKSNGSDVQAATDPADINNATATGQDPNAPQQVAPDQTAAPQQAYAPAPSAPARRRQSEPAAQSGESYQQAPQQQYQAPQQQYQAPQQEAENYGSYSNGSYGGNYDNGSSYEEGYEQGVAASQPPPPLPQYQQPECPQDGYQWTPGYWNYAQSGGYYWVPGVWVAPPYQGSLWTPGFWGVVAGVFRFRQGYWGPHVGYYGGLNYGNGYNGDGFHGGYWNNGNFMYNKSVTNINTTTIHNTYNYNVVNNNTTINNTRTSYNGGPGGVQARPSAAQMAVLREPHIRPLPQQVAHVQQAQQNRAQYASANGGRPAILAAPRPIVLQHIAAAPALANPGIRGEVARPAALAARPAAPAARPEAARPEAARPEAARPVTPMARPNEARPATPGARPAEVHPNVAKPTPEAKPVERAPAPVNHPAPVTHPAAPAARPEARPAPRPEAQPARPAERPAPQADHPAPKPEARPAPKPEARPEARPEGHPQENRPEPHGR